MMFLTQTITDLIPLQLDAWDICLRFLCAMAVGPVIGFEREFTHRPAGLRTHILVALGACAVMITGQLIFAQYRPFGATSDPARLSAQVISGVGFLGAGTIMREGANVKGLTTAASLWAVACLGIAAGGGYFEVALIGMVLMFLTLTVLEILQNWLMQGTRKARKDYTVEVNDISAAMQTINSSAEKAKCHVSNFSIENLSDGFQITFHTEFGSGGRKKRQKLFLATLEKDPAIRAVQATEDAVSV